MEIINAAKRSRTEVPCRQLRQVTGGTIRPGGSALTEEMISASKLNAGSRILDVGCGSGESAAYLNSSSRMDVIGIDASPMMAAAAANRYPELTFAVGRAEQLEYGDRIFDGVLSECTFSHLSDIKAGLNEAGRVLKADGWLMMSDLYERSRRYREGTEIEKDLSGLTDILAECGFAVRYLRDCTRELTDLSVAIIMEFGSIEQFYRENCLECGRCALCRISCRRHPGYFILAAQKVSG